MIWSEVMIWEDMAGCSRNCPAFSSRNFSTFAQDQERKTKKKAEQTDGTLIPRTGRLPASQKTTQWPHGWRRRTVSSRERYGQAPLSRYRRSALRFLMVAALQRGVVRIYSINKFQQTIL
jgi:hypothetical protein